MRSLEETSPDSYTHSEDDDYEYRVPEDQSKPTSIPHSLPRPLLPSPAPATLAITTHPIPEIHEMLRYNGGKLIDYSYGLAPKQKSNAPNQVRQGPVGDTMNFDIYFTGVDDDGKVSGSNPTYSLVFNPQNPERVTMSDQYKTSNLDTQAGRYGNIQFSYDDNGIISTLDGVLPSNKDESRTVIRGLAQHFSWLALMQDICQRTENTTAKPHFQRLAKFVNEMLYIPKEAWSTVEISLTLGPGRWRTEPLPDESEMDRDMGRGRAEERRDQPPPMQQPVQEIGTQLNGTFTLYWFACLKVPICHIHIILSIFTSLIIPIL